MSFPQLRDYIEREENSEDLLLSLVLLFGSKSVGKYKSWHPLKHRFFETYSDRIHACCGYDTGRLEIQKIELPSPGLFLHYMGAMRRSGMMGDCSYSMLSGYLDLIFNMGSSESTVLNKLKEQNPEFEYLVERMNAEKKKFKIREVEL